MYNNQEPGQEPEGENKEPFSKRVTRWIGILSSVFVVGFIIYWAYGLGRRDASEVPVVAAMEGETRTAPEDGGEAEESFTGLEVNSVLEGEEPAPSDDVTLAPQPDDLSDVEPATPSEGEEGENATAEADGDMETAEEDEELVADTSQSIPTPVRRPELLYVPQDGQAAPVAETASTEAPASNDEAEIDALVEEVEANTEPETAEVETAEAEPAQEPEPEPEPEPESAATEESGQTLPSGTPLIQLAANLDAESTRNQWAQLKADNSDILGDKSLYIEKAEVNGQLYYRLRVSGFGSAGETRTACEALMARGVQCLAVAAK